MMHNNPMVQELNDNQLDMITGGGFLTALAKTVKRRAVSAWNTIKPFAEAAVDIVEATIAHRKHR